MDSAAHRIGRFILRSGVQVVKSQFAPFREAAAVQRQAGFKADEAQLQFNNSESADIARNHRSNNQL
jgi:hypothetical protein